MSLKFEWDNNKAERNLKKHGISFNEAISIWNDEYAAFIHDPVHSLNEDRFIMIGYSQKNNLLFVSFVERDLNIRVISARKATKQERIRHEENKGRY